MMYKITQAEINANNVKSAPDTLSGTTTENKNTFDKLIELFASKYNSFIDHIDETAYTSETPINIEEYVIKHLDSGVESGQYGADETQTPDVNQTFDIPYFTVDSKGHITNAGTSEVKIPDDGNKVETAQDTATVELTKSYKTISADVKISANQNNILRAITEGNEGLFVAGQDVNADSNYTYTQSTASDTWTITHNLGKMPSITIISDGELIIGETEYINENTVVCTFSTEITGIAYLN